MGPLLVNSGMFGTECVVYRFHTASMGPLLVNSGMQYLASGTIHASNGFNGAAAREQRNAQRRQCRVRGLAMLQWGRCS